jgi:hypothetical protein
LGDCAGISSVLAAQQLGCCVYATPIPAAEVLSGIPTPDPSHLLQIESRIVADCAWEHAVKMPFDTIMEGAELSALIMVVAMLAAAILAKLGCGWCGTAVMTSFCFLGIVGSVGLAAGKSPNAKPMTGQDQNPHLTMI